MSFAIVGYFDDASNVRIREMWQFMADAGIDDYLAASENDPHFKFDIFETIDMEFVKSELESIACSYNKIPLHFKKFGFYPKKDKPFITLDIAENTEVIDLQRILHTQFAYSCQEDSRGYFTPGIWKPDIQLTISFDKVKLPLAVSILNEMDLPFDGMLQSVGLIEFHPAKQLFRIEL